MAKKSGFARAAEALAIGIGAGMEGYGKGTMASLVEQRRAALEEVRDRRAAHQALEERDWRTQESEKTREFQRETAAESMAWEKEKFGMEQAADEARTNRTLAAQERLAKLRGAGGGAKDTRTALEKKVDLHSKLQADVRKGVEGAQERLDFFIKSEGLDRQPSSRDGRSSEEKLVSALAENMQKAAQGDKAAQAWVDAFKLNNPPRSSDELTHADYVKDRATFIESEFGFRAPKKEELDALDKRMSGMGYPVPTSAEAVPGPTPPPGSVSPSQLEQAPPKKIGGEGTNEKPFEATSLEELDALLNSNDPGVWIRYKNKKYQVK